MSADWTHIVIEPEENLHRALVLLDKESLRIFLVVDMTKGIHTTYIEDGLYS